MSLKVSKLYNLLRKTKLKHAVIYVVSQCNSHFKKEMTVKGSIGTPRKIQNIEASELEQFDDIFPELSNFLSHRWSQNKEISDASDWFREVVDYNVPFGKKTRGITVVYAYKLFVKNASEEDMKLARILGWCMEWVQAFTLVADDIMDKSITRRGKPCWYKKENVGLKALNDAMYLENCAFYIIRHYFKKKSYYSDLIDLLHETSEQTVIGQCLDLITAPVNGKVDFRTFTEERYNAIVKWKTAYFSFYLPVALAMYMAGITSEEHHSIAKAILVEMGTFFQIQDDYLDCFGDPAVIGKIGTDIQDSKCTWLVIQALMRVNDDQRIILKTNYGYDDPIKVQNIIALYEELDLQTVYKNYEKNTFDTLIKLIDENCESLPKEVFKSLAYVICKRQK